MMATQTAPPIADSTPWSAPSQQEQALPPRQMPAVVEVTKSNDDESVYWGDWLACRLVLLGISVLALITLCDGISGSLRWFFSR